MQLDIAPQPPAPGFDIMEIMAQLPDFFANPQAGVDKINRELVGSIRRVEAATGLSIGLLLRVAPGNNFPTLHVMGFNNEGGSVEVMAVPLANVEEIKGTVTQLLTLYHANQPSDIEQPAAHTDQPATITGPTGPDGEPGHDPATGAAV